MPDLTTPSARSAVYGLAVLDCNGRIADNHLLRALGWDTQTRLDIREQGGLLLVTATAQAIEKVDLRRRPLGERCAA